MQILASILFLFILTAGLALIKHEGGFDWITNLDLTNIRF
jgi:hypothetical protein